MRKKPEYVRCCANCEFAERHAENDESVFCRKKKKELAPLHICRRFSYDLLKYTPARPREIPTLDPSLADLLTENN